MKFLTVSARFVKKRPPQHDFHKPACVRCILWLGPDHSSTIINVLIIFDIQLWSMIKMQHQNYDYTLFQWHLLGGVEFHTISHCYLSIAFVMSTVTFCFATSRCKCTWRSVHRVGLWRNSPSRPMYSSMSVCKEELSN